MLLHGARMAVAARRSPSSVHQPCASAAQRPGAAALAKWCCHAGPAPTLRSGIMFHAASSERLAALLDSPLRASLPLTGSTLPGGWGGVRRRRHGERPVKMCGVAAGRWKLVHARGTATPCSRLPALHPASPDVLHAECPHVVVCAVWLGDARARAGRLRQQRARAAERRWRRRPGRPTGWSGGVGCACRCCTVGSDCQRRKEQHELVRRHFVSSLAPL